MSHTDIRLSQMQRILDTTCELMEDLAVERLPHRIADVAAQLVNAESASVMLSDPLTSALRCVASTQLADQVLNVPVLTGTLAGEVFASGQTVIVPDVSVDRRYHTIPELETGIQARSRLAVLLQFKVDKIGVLQVENKRNSAEFDQEDVDLLTALAAQAAAAMTNARLVATLRKQQELAEALRRTSVALNSTLDYREVLNCILEQLGHVVPNDAANVMMIEADGKIARVFLGRGYEQFGTADTLTDTTLDFAEATIIRVIQQTGQPFVVPDVTRDPAWVYSRPEHTWIRSYIGAPISIRNQVVGFLNVMSVAPNFYNQADAERLQAFADHAAVAIKNARLYYQAQQEITERKRVEVELRQHRDHLEELVEARVAEIKQINHELTRQVAERRRAEQELEAQNAELDAFAHTVAHDLKNPLSLVSGGAAMLVEYGDEMTPAQLKETAQFAYNGASKAVSIVSNLLLLSSTHKVKIEPTPIDMAQVVQEALGQLADMLEASGQVILPDAWPAALGYAPWLEEVWVNYISNAIKYGAAEGAPPRIELGANPLTLGDTHHIRFWVRDNGQGLTADEQSRLFTPFERLSQIQVSGHGLGLSIVKRIVEKLGGQVGVESAGVPGLGSTFYFTLPAA